MLLFSEKEIRMFSEVDVNGQPAGEEDTGDTGDYTAEPVNAAGADNPPPAEDTPTEQPAEDAPPPDQGDDTDYTADSGDNAPPPDQGGGEDVDYTADGGEAPPEEGGGDAPQTSGGDGQVTADEGRGMEQELFDSLTPDQIDMKHKELKNNFLELYNSTSNIIDRVNEIPTTDEFLSTISFVGKKLAELRKMVADYMNNVYSTKSYMENAINYNRFLATLNGINDILAEVNKELSKNVKTD